MGLPVNKDPATSKCLNMKKELTFSPRTIANTFKKHFANLASDHVNKRPDPTKKFGIPSEYLTRELTSLEKKRKFGKVNSLSILKILKEFEANKVTGVDNLVGRFLKDGSNILCTLISTTCALSIKLPFFPDNFKVAKIKDLHKKGFKTGSKNFRSISLLPLISKIIERIIHDQTMNFLSDNNVLYKHQSGFRKFHSIDTCLSYLRDKIIKGLDSGLLTGMVLVGIQKAFDILNQDILIKKMSILGFTDEILKWYTSYLSNRKFIISMENAYSDKAAITCGVPQASTLGSLLF